MKSIIDKTNNLWKWRKSTNKEKEAYRKQYGLEMKEIGIMTSKAYDIYLQIIRVKDHGNKPQ